MVSFPCTVSPSVGHMVDLDGRWVTRWEGRHRGTKQQALLGSAGRSVHVGFKLRGSGLQVRLEKQVNK